jgi:ubiquinone/menaquinone biosynthesis C-methylase UbiE
MFDDGRYYARFASACARNIAKDCGKYFKRYAPELPRIEKVLGMLKTIRPDSLLDIGPGRGRSLWPMLETLPECDFTCIDSFAWRTEVINAVGADIGRLRAFEADACDMRIFSDGSFDVVTALEVFEHIRDVERAIREAVRVARNFVIVSVPSKPDDNPDHVHFLPFGKLSAMLLDSGKAVAKLTKDYASQSMLVFTRIENGQDAQVP